MTNQPNTEQSTIHMVMLMLTMIPPSNNERGQNLALPSKPNKRLNSKNSLLHVSKTNNSRPTTRSVNMIQPFQPR